MADASFGKKTTAEEASAGVDLRGRHAVVTGANTGLGQETARVLALRGAEVTLACRDLGKAETARQMIDESCRARGVEPVLHLQHLDLADLASVDRAADALLASERPIHLLLNNAGVMLPRRRETSDGFEAHLGINHLGHFRLTTRLCERLVDSAPARVVMVSSDALHFATLTSGFEDLNWKQRRFRMWRAYGDSKLMNLLFARELSRRLGEKGVVSHALHPGVIGTELAREFGILMRIVGIFMLPVMKSVPQGAATAVYAATAPELGKQGGGYFSDCAPARDGAKSRDTELADELWAKSEELCVGVLGA